MFQRPIRQFVVKITEECNFACKDCYFLGDDDTAYRLHPKNMSNETVNKLALHLSEYVASFLPKSIEILLHGGEPLMRGTEFISFFVDTIRKSCSQYTHVYFTLQTNGLLYKNDMLKVCQDKGILVGISLDGPSGKNPRRVLKNGLQAQSYVIDNMHSMIETQNIAYDGILSVVDLEINPEDTIRYFAELRPILIDFLLPDSTYDKLPPGVADINIKQDTKYAHWLLCAFDYWYENDDIPFQIRIFDSIIALLQGRSSKVEGFGKQSIGSLTIMTDGEIRANDIMDFAYVGASRFGDGWYLDTNCFSELQQSQEFLKLAYSQSVEALCNECKRCEYKEVCGGGLFAHRFNSLNGFNNPSVYCSNLFALIDGIKKRIS